jgi:hypothetical protein
MILDRQIQQCEVSWQSLSGIRRTKPAQAVPSCHFISVIMMSQEDCRSHLALELPSGGLGQGAQCELGGGQQGKP